MTPRKNYLFRSLRPSSRKKSIEPSVDTSRDSSVFNKVSLRQSITDKEKRRSRSVSSLCRNRDVNNCSNNDESQIYYPLSETGRSYRKSVRMTDSTHAITNHNF